LFSILKQIGFFMRNQPNYTTTQKAQGIHEKQPTTNNTNTQEG